MYQFESKEQMLAYLAEWDLDGLDSEWSAQSRRLVETFNAKEIDVNRWWVLTPVNWSCPCCKRGKAEIVRMNAHGHLKGDIHEHHDHVIDSVRQEFTLASENLPRILADESAKKFFRRIAFGFSAYDNTLVCSDCNEADAKAKKLLKFKSGSYFSFSPKEISEFIIVEPNKAHEIDAEKAYQVWMAAKPMFEKRLELIKHIAYLAATDSHWYQPSEKTAQYEERIGNMLFKHYGLTKLSPSGPEGLLYQTNKHQGLADSWRRKRNLPNSPPMDGQVRHMAALEYSNFNSFPDDWVCNICHRAKFACIRKANSGKWSFTVSTRTTSGSSRDECEMCKDCADVSMNIGIEVKKLSGNQQLRRLASLISLVDLEGIIKPQPHCKHNINNEAADQVVSKLVEIALQGGFDR